MPRPTSTRRQRKHRRRILLPGVLVALGFIALTGYHYYPSFTEKQSVKNARSALATNDLRSAAVLARRAVQINPRDPAAVRVMIEVSERFKDPSRLAWKARLVELEPWALESRLSLARTALDLNDPAAAQTALEPARETGKRNATYHALAGEAAHALQEIEFAEVEFAAASSLESSNLQYQLKLASERLHSPKAEIQAEARVNLEMLSTHPSLFIEGSRVLLRDALEKRQRERALSLAAALESAPSAPMQDRIIFLDLLHETNSAAYPALLTRLEEEAIKNPDDVFVLLSWMNMHHAVMSAADWSKQFPADLLATLPVRVGLAESLAMEHDWTKLEPLVSSPNGAGASAKNLGSTPLPIGIQPEWSDYEYRRLAYCAAILQAKGDRAHAATEWDLAIKAAGKWPEAHLILARYGVAYEWGDPTESLWQAANGSSDQPWALHVLYRRYRQSQSAAGMYRVMARSLQLNPNDTAAQNNFAMLGLLLRTGVPEAVELARQVHEKERGNANYAATYAFGMFAQGKISAAAQIVRELTKEQAEQPQIAAYMAIILSAEGSWEEASRYLELSRSARLLPEEKDLLARAEAQIRFESQPRATTYEIP